MAHPVQRHRPRVTFANVTSLLALVVALSGGVFAVASVPGPSGTIRACLTKSGAVRVIDHNRRCARKERTLTWNQRGRTGSRGLQGTAGPNGAAGANGVAGAGGATGQQGLQGLPGQDGSPDTPLQVLAKLVDLDGPGSGLDADTLDGLNSAAFTATPDEMCSPFEFMTGWEQDGDAVCGPDTAGTIADNSIGRVSTSEPDQISDGTIGGEDVENGSLTGTDIKDRQLSRIDYTSTSGATHTASGVSVGPQYGGYCTALSVSAPGVSVGDIGMVVLDASAPNGMVVRNQNQTVANQLHWQVCSTGGNFGNWTVTFHLTALR